MNLTVNTTAFAVELRLINQIAAAKHSLPILTNVLLNANEHLYLYATDLEVGFNTACRAQVEEPGSVALPAKRLLDLVEQLPDSDLQIRSDGPHVRISCGNFQSRLQVLPAEDFPLSISPTGDTTTISVPTLRAMIKRARYAITDKGNFAVRGAQFTVTPTAIGLVSTDGKRLSLTTANRAGTTESTALLPTKTLDAVSALFEAGDILFSQSDQHLFFVCGHRLLTSRTLVAQFPAYQRIIPKENNHRAVLNRAPLAAALRRVVFVSAESQQVYLSFRSGALQLNAASAEVGEAIEVVGATYEGPDLRVCTSAEYLLDFLDAASNPEIAINLKDSKEPLLMTDGVDFMNVVLLSRA